MSSHPELGQAALAFVDDPHRYYDAYINGNLSFAEQRLHRVGTALQILELDGQPDEELWVVGYEDIVSANWAPYDDVTPLLKALTDSGIPYGAVTNNVTDYQAHKLEQAGLPFEVVIGTDITGKPKPHASMFLEGAHQLDVAPQHTAMIGDDLLNDGFGARDAGLISVLLDRDDVLDRPEGIYKVQSLSDVLHIDALRFDNTRN